MLSVSTARISGARRCAAEFGCRPMPCYHPLHGYYSKHENPTGKRSWVRHLSQAKSAEGLSLPCGRCIGCRLERSRQWAVRCVHEAALHEDNAFITLTYDDDHLPYGGTLKKKTSRTLRNDSEKNIRRRARSNISIAVSTASGPADLTITLCCSDLTSLIRRLSRKAPTVPLSSLPRFCNGCGRPVSVQRELSLSSPPLT